MAKKGNKKRSYHRPPAHKASTQKSVRLSQCMIVKNEEKNIERALSWAKGFAFEQIVVDTGSTDKTIEIAERMGAKVFHFEWINDFSAAKNFAIEQASGDWIAFLDADEYMVEEDVKKLSNILQTIESNNMYRKINTAISCPLVSLDDNGQPFSVHTQLRFFKNAPEIHYVGSIHEILVNLSTPHFSAPEISIIHTGYSDSAYADTMKAERNVQMIQAELDKNPDDATLKCYLADSFLRTAPNDVRIMQKVDALYHEVLASEQDIPAQLKQSAYSFLILRYFHDNTHEAESMELCKNAYDEFRLSPDFCFYYGRKLYDNCDFNAAWDKFTECEKLLSQDLPEESRAEYVIQNAMFIFYQMVLTAEELGITAEVIRCATLVLKEDKYQHAILAPYIAAFNKEGYMASPEDILSILMNIYDFTKTRDKLTVLQAAKSAFNSELVQIILNMLNPEEIDLLVNPL